MRMGRKNGAELIADFLIKENIRNAFGICGHDNVGLHNVRDEIKLVSGAKQIDRASISCVRTFGNFYQ
jgi:hypothetical protein